MSAIDFVVRDVAGNMQRGSVAGDGATQSTIIVGADADISLNLYRAHIVSYSRQGQALQITLIDGRVIVIEGFFGVDGEAENRLLISADGAMAEVDLTGGGEGVYYAQYTEADNFGKWSPDDDLYFVRGQEVQIAQAADAAYQDDEVGMLAAPLLGGLGGIGTGLGAAAAAAAGAAVLGSGSGGGNDGPSVQITEGTSSSGTIVNAEDHADGVDISGTGTPGATITVEVGDESQTTTVTDDGDWTVTFPTDQIDPGDYETTVTVTITDEDGETATATDTLVVDTIAEVSLDTVEGDDLINAAELEDGVQLSGTVEAGSTVTVTVQGMDYTATVTGGTWSVTVPSTNVDPGEYEMDVVVTTTDTNSNTASLTHTVTVDTMTEIVMATGAIGGDGTVNAVEHAEGITVTGFAEAGATVVVTFGTVSQTTTAGSDGAWSVDYTTLQIPAGTYTAEITAVSTDLAGNTATATGTFEVDTEMTLSVDTASVEGGTVNADEASDGITITGQAEPNATVVVEMNGFTHTTTASSSGAWSVDFAAGEVPSGTLGAPVNVTATDPSGNVESVTGTVQIDTEASVAFSPVPVEIDGVVNAAEAADGVVINGTSEPGSTVIVSFGTMTQPANVDSSGTWSVNFPASAVQPGEYDVTVTAQATDAHGNSATASMDLPVDTITSVSVETATVEFDGIINQLESQDGVSLTGTAEPGASVQVTFAGVTNTVNADQAGNWTAFYTSAAIPQGETVASVNVIATDMAGNTATTQGTVNIDTFVNQLDMTGPAPGGDGVINLEESAQPITLTGVVEQGSTVDVMLGTVTMPATVAANGSWTVTFPAGALPGGEYTSTIQISATDAAGNTTTITDTVEVDTVVGDVALSPAPIEIDDVVNAVESSDGVVISGSATPGLTVTVTLGSASHQVVAAPNGSWSTTFLPGEVPAGTYTSDITASITDAAGNSKTVTDTVDIDTEIDLAWGGPVTADNVISGAEAAAGVTVTGTVEAGSQVSVTLGGATAQATVTGTTWSATFAPGQLPAGETFANMSATATDPAGNVADITGTVGVDTIVNTLTTTDPVEGDNAVNSDEAADGITLTGTVEAGSQVVVTLEGTPRVATVDGQGNWSVTFSADDIPDGDYETTVTIEATDAVGNVRSITDTFVIDTEIPDAPLIESFTTSDTGVREIGVALTDDPMTVQELTASGNLAPLGYDTDINPRWGEIDFEFENEIPDGSHLVVTSEDDTGNNNSTLFVLEENGTNTVDLSPAGLDNVNIGAIDLQFAEESELTLTPELLASLSENSNELIVHGGEDDTVFMDVGSPTGSTVIGDHTYDIYTLGTDGTVIIDQDIEIQPTSVV